MLDVMQHAIAKFEVARIISPDATMTVRDFCADILGVAPETYYKHLKAPEVSSAIDDMVKQAKTSKDFMASVMHDIALQNMYEMAVDKEIPIRERQAALRELHKMTESTVEEEYVAPYPKLSDEELREIVVDRKGRLNATDDEITKLLMELKDDSKQEAVE